LFLLPPQLDRELGKYSLQISLSNKTPSMSILERLHGVPPQRSAANVCFAARNAAMPAGCQPPFMERITLLVMKRLFAYRPDRTL